MTLLDAALGGAGGFGLYMMIRGARRAVGRQIEPSTRRVLPKRGEAGLGGRPSLVGGRDAATAAVVGVIALVITRWPMAVFLGAAATLGLKGLSGGTSRQQIDKLEAIASWTEMLRDTLAGASGLTQALVATAGTAPAPVAYEIRALAGKLTAGVPIEDALRELADDIADPAADMVVASLVMASRERAQRLGDLLSALAQAIREEVAMRLGIEASRASSQTAVRMITGFSLGLFGLMCVFARAYLAPYESPPGQLMLGVVGLVFALGLWLMSVMVRPHPFARLLLSDAETTR
ncbi:MAG: type II secretion system F family protein [Acidimicrobiales bacterium]